MQTIPSPMEIIAEPFTRLPDVLHWAGEPNDWVRATRPGLRLHSFIEGVCFDASGSCWLVDVPYGRIFRISADGNWSLAHCYDGEPHGLACLPDGRFAIADYRRGLLTFDPLTGEIAVLCDRINTECFRGLSDVKVAPNGDLWFTDPGRSSLSDSTGRLFCLRAGRERPDLILDNLPYPNGVAIGPDGRFAFVTVTRANAVWRLLTDAPDPVWPMSGVFLNLSGGLGPDGIDIDAEGRIAIAQAQAGRAYLFDSNGDAVARIRTPGGNWTTSVAFTPDGQLVILDAQTGTVFRVRLP